MKKQLQKFFAENYLFVLLLLVIVVIKIPYLHLPYFWDEAWAYANATHHLYETRISLMPDAAPVEFTRGHPLLLHATIASGFRIFGSSPAVAHSIMLFVALIICTVVYFVFKPKFGKFAALFPVALLFLHPAFFTQSVLLLPETWIVLFTLLMFLALEKDKYLLFAVFCSLAFLTKESAIAVWFSFFLLYLSAVFLKKKSFRLSQLFYLFVPLLFWMGYLLVQKSVKGWYFFPEHTQLISFSFSDIITKAFYFFRAVVFNEGRIVISAFVVLLIVVKMKRNKILFSSGEISLLLFAGIFSVVFLLFSSLNYYSSRYVLVVDVIWILTMSFLVLKSLSGFRFLTAVCFSLLFFSSVILITRKGISDVSPVYTDGVHVMKEIISVAEEKNLYNEKIYAPFLIRENLVRPCLAYLSGEKTFTSLYPAPGECDYAIISNFEDEEFRKEIMNPEKWKIIHEVKSGSAFAVLAKKKSESESTGY